MFIDYSLYILLLPLFAFVIQIFIGKKLPRQGDWVSITAIIASLILAIIMFVSMISGYDPNFKEEASFTWFEMGSGENDFKVKLGFLVDNLTIIMLLVVTLISLALIFFLQNI